MMATVRCPREDVMPASQQHATALRRKAKKGFLGYPVATVAYYGPDDNHATKVAVGILTSEDSGVTRMERWFSQVSDVRTDPGINAAVLQLIGEHKVRSVAMYDRIIGCPHEEGVDYPLGEACPRCPFWASRDRWSGEKLG
jgi:hypothetical protein